jgi:uncharacterized tellurite resistance protein B-like protein
MNPPALPQSPASNAAISSSRWQSCSTSRSASISEFALADLFGLDTAACAALLREAPDKGGLTSYYAQVAVIKRDFSMEQRVALIEHLWRISYAHGELDLYEDHFVRKIAHLLYVPNTQTMLARSRAQQR